MSTLDLAESRARDFNTRCTASANEAAVKAEALKGVGLIAQAEQQRITNLITLLPHVDSASKQNILDDLGSLLGIELVPSA